LGNIVADLLFPPHCVACRRLGAWLCVDCLDGIEVFQPPLCHRCGMPGPGGRAPQRTGLGVSELSSLPKGRTGQWICHQCRATSSNLDGFRSYARHGGPLRQAIHEFKYNGLRSLSAILGELMGEAWPYLAPHGIEMDAIVPVPLHPSRQRVRGFNQAGLLCRELVVHLRLPLVQDVLIRSRRTSPQVGLSPRERRANVDGAFHCANDSLAGKRVLLVDDVYTTGSTLEAAGFVLRKTGVLSVWAYTLARADGAGSG
jgi:ComF family protein